MNIVRFAYSILALFHRPRLSVIMSDHLIPLCVSYFTCLVMQN